jgi:dihydroxyacetone kinase-like predicted kinase
MAANQSAEAYKDANVVVIPSKTVAEGIAALSIMNPADSAENIISDMKYACNNVSTLFVTKATRDCMINGFTISKNDYIGLCGDDILAVESDPGSVAFETVKRINENDDKQVVTIYYGSKTDESSAEELSEKITEEYPFIETGVVCGGQDVYDYMISVE